MEMLGWSWMLLVLLLGGERLGTPESQYRTIEPYTYVHDVLRRLPYIAPQA
jgi:hypothetical protein